MQHNVMRWHKGTQKFYEARLAVDIFNEWSITCVWGSLRSRAGNYRNHCFATKQAACDFISALNKRRKQRGYQEVTPC